jgi:PPOX class probable F420-dependent enzyme
MISELQGQNYINLETYEKNGQPIRTPVAFVQDNGVIYVRTDKNSGKVKRLRNNPHVRIVPCDIRARPKGEWVVTIQIASEHESERAKKLLNEKYGSGFRGMLLNIMYKFRKIDFVFLSIR